jgi:hypothetical protein
VLLTGGAVERYRFRLVFFAGTGWLSARQAGQVVDDVPLLLKRELERIHRGYLIDGP